MKHPVAIFGLDGATWDIVDPLLAQGKMPNLARLMERGAYGRVATLPGHTSPALWTSILTGKEPAKHGVRDFYTANSQSMRAKTIYEILAPDQPVGLFQMYAARLNDQPESFVVPSRIENAATAYPADLAFIAELGEVKSRRGYLTLSRRCLANGVPAAVLVKAGLLSLSKVLGRFDKQSWNYRSNIMGQQMRGHIAAHLVKQYRPHFFVSLFYILDHFGHYYWQYWQPSLWTGFDQAQIEIFGQVLENAYIEVDKNIGLVLQALQKKALVIVVSDHGMEAAPGERGGKPLTLKGSEILGRLGLSGSFVSELLPPFQTIFRAKPPEWAPVDSAKLQDNLSQARLDDGSAPFLVENPDPETLLVKKGPDLRNKLAMDLSFPSGHVCQLSQLLFEHQEISGTHARQGILVLSGPDVSQGTSLPESNILDVTPTILALVGSPIARDMDGTVVEEAIDDAFLGNHPLSYVDTFEDGAQRSEPEVLIDTQQKEIEARLRDLGYLA